MGEVCTITHDDNYAFTLYELGTNLSLFNDTTTNKHTISLPDIVSIMHMPYDYQWRIDEVGEMVGWWYYVVDRSASDQSIPSVLALRPFSALQLWQPPHPPYQCQCGYDEALDPLEKGGLPLFIQRCLVTIFTLLSSVFLCFPFELGHVLHFLLVEIRCEKVDCKAESACVRVTISHSL